MIETEFETTKVHEILTIVENLSITSADEKTIEWEIFQEFLRSNVSSGGKCETKKYCLKSAG